MRYEWRRLGLTTILVVFGVFVAPLAAEAQPAGKTLRIGVLANLDTPDMEGLRQGLRELGYIDGHNVTVDWRWSEAKTERLPSLAAELASGRPDVIVASGTQAVRAAREASSTTPIVMVAVSFPENIGLVDSLARPGGNITGLSNISSELNAKRLELLKEIAPGITRVHILWNPTSPVEHFLVKELTTVAPVLGLETHSIEVRTPEEHPAAIAGVTLRQADALVVNGNPVNHRNRQLIAAFAMKNRLPTIFDQRLFVEAGGLIAYGPNYTDMFRRSASYVDKILKGTKPADLPVEQPTKFDLVINRKTAQALGLTIPPTLLARADEVIE